MVKVALALKTQVTALPDAELKRLESRFPDVDFSYIAFDPDGSGGLADAEVLYSYVITPRMLDEARSLRWFHSVVTGPDAYAFDALVKSDVKVTSPRGVYSVPIAETALGMMLALARRIRGCILAQAEGRWCALDLYREETPSSELSGAKVMIVGMGGIGTALAERCSAMGMHVTGVVREMRERPPCADELVTFDDFRTALPAADFVVLACPLTKATRGMIGKDELSSMKRSAFLINVARGELVDEEALVSSLNGGIIAGAASDVFTTEPLPEGHPLFAARNMIVMPHVSGFSSRIWERAVDRFAENLRLFLDGKTLIGEVDFERGY